MTRLLYREDAYLKTADGNVTGETEAGVILDQTIFYARGGGQPGDKGSLTWDGGTAEVIDTVKGEAEAVVLVLADGATRPPVGTAVTQTLDWNHRFGCMRVHTALHLLSVVIPLPVTGGAISPDKGRLDFMMPEPPEDKAALEAELNALIARDLIVTESFISEEELDAQPELVKTMSVQPPRGGGLVRLIRIDDVDLQPCGGTHVVRSSEIGAVRIGKIENKGKQNRRVTIHLT